MERREALEFLTAGTRTGKVATVRPDGRPHVAPVWFTVEDGHVVFTTWHASVKARNLRRDPRASLVVDLEEPPYAFALVEGAAELVDDPDEARRVSTIVGGRYMGEERAAEYGTRNGVAGELVVRLRIDRLVARSGIAD
jgi:PPOX class probable F420-dependent enzyme